MQAGYAARDEAVNVERWRHAAPRAEAPGNCARRCPALRRRTFRHPRPWSSGPRRAAPRSRAAGASGLGPRNVQVVSSDLAEMNAPVLLLAQVDPHAEMARVGGNQAGGDPGGHVALVLLAVPVTGEGVVVGRPEALDGLPVDGDPGVHGTVPVAVVFDEIQELVP